MNPTLDSTAPDGTAEKLADGRYVLRFERRLSSPVERVWQSLTDPGELVKWLAEADIDLREDGRIELRWLNTNSEGEHSVARGTISRLEAPTLVEWDTDIHGVVRWELDPAEDGGCVLRLTATGAYTEEDRLSRLAGWHTHLGHLADALDGRPVEWERWDSEHRPTFAEHRERYAAAR